MHYECHQIIYTTMSTTTTHWIQISEITISLFKENHNHKKNPIANVHSNERKLVSCIKLEHWWDFYNSCDCPCIRNKNQRTQNTYKSQRSQPQVAMANLGDIILHPGANYFNSGTSKYWHLDAWAVSTLLKYRSPFLYQCSLIDTHVFFLGIHYF